MAVDETFRAVISVDDRTSAPIRRIQQNLARIGENSGLVRLGRIAGRLTTSMGGLARATASVAAPLAAAGALGAGIGLTAMLRTTVDAAGALNDLSTQLGISVEDLQALQFAAGQAGVAPEALTGSLEKLQRGMREASTGGNKSLLALFRRLRIPLRDAKGQLRGAADVMPELAEAFRKNENPALRTAMAFALFGRSGGPMIRMLADGSESLKDMMRRWMELDGSIRTVNKGALDEVGDKMGEVQTALAGVRNAIVVRLAPALAPMLKQLADWIAANKELVATTVEGWVLKIAEALKGFDLKKTIEGVEGFFGKVKATVEAMGGWENSIKLVGGALALSIVAPLATIATSLTKIFAMTVPAWLLALMRFGGGIPAGVAAGIGANSMIDRSPQHRAQQRQDLLGWKNGQPPGLSGRERLTDAFQGLRDWANRNFSASGPDGAARPAAPVNPLNPLSDPATGRPLFRLQSFRPGDEAGSGQMGRRPSIWDRPSAAPQRDGTHRLEVEFMNTPPGTRVRTESSGNADRFPVLSVGYARMGIA
jgi:hypothetical protein